MIQSYGCQCDHFSVQSSDMKGHIRRIYKLDPEDNIIIDQALLISIFILHQHNQTIVDTFLFVSNVPFNIQFLCGFLSHLVNLTVR